MSFIQDNKNKKKLSFYDFSKDIPKNLDKLIKLEELDFDNAPEIPKSIGKLPQLKFLKIKSKTLEELPNSIGNLSSLVMLTIECPNLKKLPEIACKWPNLTYLNVQSNVLTSIPQSYANCEILDYVCLKLGTDKLIEGLDAFANNKNLGLSLEAKKTKFFPQSLLNLKGIKEMTLTLKLKKLPDNLGQITSIERLSLYMDELLDLPQSIGQLKNIWELNLYTPFLLDYPSSMAEMNVKALSLRGKFTAIPAVIMNMKSLTSLAIEKSQIQQIPDSIVQLKKLESIYFHNNSLLKELSDAIGQLPNLKSLSLSSNALTSLPDVFGQLPNIEDIRLYGNQIQTLPPSMGQLKAKPVYLSYEENPFGRIHEVFFEMNLKDAYYTGGYRNSEELKAYIDYAKKQGATKEFYSTLCGIFEAAIDLRKNTKLAFRHLEKYDFRALLSVYNFVTGIFRDTLVNYLTQQNTSSIEQLNLKSPQLAIAGSINLKKASVKAALKGSTIQYSAKVNPDCNIIILGNNIKNIAEILNCQEPTFINEVKLNELVEKLNQPYLVEAAKSEDTSFNQQVSDLLLNKDSENVAIGIEMLAGGGVPNDLMGLLFGLHKMHPDKKIAAKAKKLLLPKASDLLKERIKVRVNWRGKDKMYRHELWQILRDTELEPYIWQICLADYFWQGSTTALAQNFDKFPKSLLPELIEAFSSEHHQYNVVRINDASLFPFLDQFYQHLKSPKELYLDLQYLGKAVLAQGISKVKRLERLTLEYKEEHIHKNLDFSKPLELPTDIGKCKNLSTLIIKTEQGWQQLPKNIDKAKQISNLIIKVDLSNSVDVSNLKPLTQLKHLALSFTKVGNLDIVVQFLTALPPFQNITFNYEHKEAKKHLSLWKKTMSNYNVSISEWGAFTALLKP